MPAELGGIARIWRPSRSLERARQLEADGQQDAALAEYSRLIDDRPDDARLLIERGRLYYEMGRTSEADADYARAARLAPDNPQVFLETAGWWIAGPYPPDLTVPAAFQADTAIDPSKPAPPAGSEARRWQRAAVEMQGRLDLRKVYNADDAAAYALAIFNCPTEREVVLLWGRDDDAAVYFNGIHITPDQRGQTAFGNTFFLIPTRAGRNTVLVKVVNQKEGHSLNLVISQAPADYARAHAYFKRWDEAIEDYRRALVRDPSSRDPALFWNGGTALAEAGRFEEAVPAWQRACQLNPDDAGNRERLAAVYLGANDLASVRRIAVEMAEKYRQTKDPNLSNAVAWIGALVPDAHKD